MDTNLLQRFSEAFPVTEDNQKESKMEGCFMHKWNEHLTSDSGEGFHCDPTRPLLETSYTVTQNCKAISEDSFSKPIEHQDKVSQLYVSQDSYHLDEDSDNEKEKYNVKHLMSHLESLERKVHEEKLHSLQKMRQFMHEQDKNHEMQRELVNLKAKLANVDTQLTYERQVTERKNHQIMELQHDYEEMKLKMHAQKEEINEKEREKIAISNQLANLTLQYQNHEETTSDYHSSLPEHFVRKDKYEALKNQYAQQGQTIQDHTKKLNEWKITFAQEMRGITSGDSLLRIQDFVLKKLQSLPDRPLHSHLSENNHQQLERKLKLLEDELNETAEKYKEMKDICARQCLREVDLQNYVNELQQSAATSLPPKKEEKNKEQVKSKKKKMVKEKPSKSKSSLQLTSSKPAKTTSETKKGKTPLYRKGGVGNATAQTQHGKSKIQTPSERKPVWA